MSATGPDPSPATDRLAESGSEPPRTPDRAARGLLWSHLLASLCGGLALAGVLLGFGVIGRQRTVTVPIDDYSTAPPTDAGGSAQPSSTDEIYASENPAVLYVRAVIGQRVSSPFIAGTESRGSISTGSGFLIADRAGMGYVLTTFHQIQGANYASGITVQFSPGVSRRASGVYEFDQANDVALLQVPLKGLQSQPTPLSFGNSRSVGVGDSTLSIANPVGLERTLSSSIVSSLQRQLTAADNATIADVIQTDAPASPGLSGSPLLNVAGQVIGINDQMEVTSGGSSYLVGFAIPINTAEALVVPKGLL